MGSTAGRVALFPLLLAAAEAASPSGARGQLRGLPVYFEPLFSHDTQVHIDIGHGGEAGLAVAAGASHLFPGGNCRRLALAGGAGIFNPPGDGFDTDLMAGALGSILLNPCPRPTSIANPAFRAFAGAGVARTAGETVASVPVGIGAGYMLPIAIARVELWTTPRVHYREAVAPPHDPGWDLAVSAGLYLGVAGAGGVRVALDCCEGGLGAAYGFSLWF